MDQHLDEPTTPDGDLDCDTAREFISASADGELDTHNERRLGVHLDGCVECTAYAERVASLTRSVRLRPLEASPQFVDRVLARSATARLGRGAWLRPALAWCGIVLAVQAVPPLVFAELDGAATHVARHVGASALALAIGFLFVAWRPQRAAGLLPFVAALLATTLVGAVLDTVNGERSALAEATHLAELVGLVLLWMVAGSPGWERLRSLVPASGSVREVS